MHVEREFGGRLRWCLVGVLVLLRTHSANAEPRRPLKLYTVHSGETLVLRDVGLQGGPKGWRRANRALQSRRTRTARAMHPRLLRALHHIQRHFGAPRVEVVSGYRKQEDGKGAESFHHVGRAADIRLPGVSDRELLEFCRSLPGLGCGFYPNAHFVHVDVRAASGLWVDLGGRRYVSRPALWLQRY